MSFLTDAVRFDGEYRQLTDAVNVGLSAAKPLPLVVTGLCDGASDSFFASFLKDLKEKKGTKLILCGSEKECSRLCGVLKSESVGAGVYLSRDYNFYNLSASHDYERERLMVLYELLKGDLDAVITTPDAALGYTMPPELLTDRTLFVDRDSTIDIRELANLLISSGYRRVEMVDGAGQFAIRGGIVDIYPPYAVYKTIDDEDLSGSLPIRIELFGDEIDRMGIFDVTDQRVTQNIAKAELPPSKEVLLDADDAKKIMTLIDGLLKKTGDSRAKEELENEKGALSMFIESGAEAAFIDKYITVVYPQKATLLDYFQSRPIVLVKNTKDVEDREKSSRLRYENEIKELVEAGTVAGAYAEYRAESAKLDLFLSRSLTVNVDAIARGLSGRKSGGLFNFSTRHTVSYYGNFALLCDDMDSYRKNGWKMIVAAENDTSAANLKGYFGERGFTVSSCANLDELGFGDVAVVSAGNIHGYDMMTPKIAVLSTLPDERNASAASRSLKKSKRKNSGETIMSFAELSVGDYVVHENYGIGIYNGIENLTVEGVSRDYINIKFAGTDRLYLPTEKIDLLSKYIGAHSDDGYVKLSKLGGAEWGKSKTRAKTAVKEIAKDLIKLYAERMRRAGFAFPADDDFQRDFEAAFPYEETDAQLVVSDEIKSDMKRPVPMDRLLCGDVGFGKTEVALRAVYKAILGGKQAAILVPTTILALQHYQTALSRMRSFPVKIDMLSRFRTPKQQEATVRALKRGDTDLIIGTHRLLSKDIAFKDLGLLVIDEEQRFGVAQKERIKQISGNIDVLTLTATPIPRTLNMAMSGIRDISVLDEAPGDRLPVQTYVLEDDDLIIFDAIRRELDRKGQVFYLHNVIETIDTVAAKIQKEFPDAKIVTAHGKMEKERLEDIWRAMLLGDIDVLVCTSIIETGIDVPNANTLIVDNAHRLGLSQLHQIRGRVGRSSRRAYAYFTFPKHRALPEIAEKRLEALKEYTEFGAGFRIAMRDLELRGAGNLLGAEQHGHLDAIGYDLYIKLLHEAVLEERGETVKPRAECSITLDFNAFIPEKYVSYQPQRMALYKRIATVETQADADDIADELSDRFGVLPEEVENLLTISLLRAKAIKCGFKKVVQNGGNLNITPEKFEYDIWTQVMEETDAPIRAVLSGEPYVVAKLPKKEKQFAYIEKIFDKYIEISCRQNGDNGV